MVKRASPAERKAFLKEQEGPSMIYREKGMRKLPANMDFVDREGRIVRPTRENPFPGVKGYVPESEIKKFVDAIAGAGSWDAEKKRQGYGLKSAGRKSHYDSTRAEGSDESNSRYHSYNRLNRTAYASLGIIGVIGGIFFLSANLTGNAVANMTTTNSTWIGGALFLVGLVAGSFYLSRKNK